ncbi:MAG: arginase [Solirubrobacterales bacterium]
MKVSLIGVPIYFGSDIKGVDFGPDKLREKNIDDIITRNNHILYDLGNIHIYPISEDKKYNIHPNMKYLEPIVKINTNLAHQVYSSLTSGSFPFVVGGDHSLGLGSISGASKHFKNLAVIWVDAHGDINTHETSPSGNIHGMPLAAAMGIGYKELTDLYFKGIKVNPENVFVIGARELDKGEIKLINDKKLNVYSTNEINKRGIDIILKEIINIISNNNVDALHLSFDIDCLDSELVPGTGTPVKDGMSLNQVKFLLEYLAKTNLVKSLDFVELNSFLDKNDSTTNLVVDLIDWTFKHLNQNS